MRRVAAGLASLALLGVVVVGGLMGLLQWGQLSALGEIDWSRLFTAPDDGRLLVAVLTLIGWGAWLAVVASVVAEVLNALPTTARHIQLPGLGWLQPMVGVLVAAVLGLSVALSHSPGAIQSGPQPLSASVSATATQPGASTAAPMPRSATSDSASSQVPAGPLPSQSGAQVPKQGTTEDYAVQPGDDLWTLAEQRYGNGSQWRLIASANPGLNVEAPLLPGTVIALPAPMQVNQPGDPGPEHGDTSSGRDVNKDEVVVRAGDTLSGLALTYLGDANRWPEIYRLNSNLIADPDLIYIGWTLKLPVADTATPNSSDSGSDSASPGPVSTPPSSEVPSPQTPQPSSPQATSTPQASTPQASTGTPSATPASAGATPATASASPASPPATPGAAPSETPVAAPAVAEEASPAGDPTRVIAGSLCGLSAVAIIGGLTLRRRLQLAQRPVGRALPRPGPAAVSFRTAAGRISEQVPALPDMAPAVVEDPDGVQAGDGVQGSDEDQALGGADPRRLREVRGPADPTPTAALQPGRLEVLVGQRGNEAVLVDLGRHGLVSVNAECAEPLVRTAELMAGMTVSLVTSPWSVGVHVIASGLDWITAVDDVNVRTASRSEAVDLVRAELASRRLAAAQIAEPDWEPWVLVVTETLPAHERDVLISACEAQVGIAAVVADNHPVPWIAGGESITITSPQAASLSRSDPFVPQLLDAASQAALGELYRSATSEETVPAPWWHTEDPPMPVLNPQPVTVREVEPMLTAHPVLKVLGPVELTGARGTLPSRAIKQCEEYCAWLLQNPGSSARQMTQSLMVAETTRRSNMSRLRTWLGADDEGNPYLPEAFTGRIALAPEVSCDWERVQALIGPGVNHTGDQALTDALGMVNGAPLADAAPGQWAWAEEWRIEMTSTVRDMAVELADRALRTGDLEMARWAAGRGLSTSPGDELLMGRRIRTEHLAGNQAEVERLVLFMTRHARAVGIDLLDDTVVLLQEVMEGRPRQRRA